MTEDRLPSEDIVRLEQAQEEIRAVSDRVCNDRIDNEALKDALINAEMRVSLALDVGTPGEEAGITIEGWRDVE